MICLRCGMAPYMKDWYEGEVICPCCGHFPTHGKPCLPREIARYPNNMLLNEGPVIKDNSHNPGRILKSGCKWWEGYLMDGTKKTCFNCGWEDCVKSDQAPKGTDFIYKAREAKKTGIIYPDGPPKDDCYVP